MAGYLEKLNETATLGGVFTDLYASVALELAELEGMRTKKFSKRREAGQTIPDTHLELGWPSEDLKGKRQGRTMVWATHETERRVPLVALGYELHGNHTVPLSVSAYEGQEYVPFPSYSLFQEEPGGLIACIAESARNVRNRPGGQADIARCAPSERIANMSPEYKQKLDRVANKVTETVSVLEYMIIEGLELSEALQEVRANP